MFNCSFEAMFNYKQKKESFSSPLSDCLICSAKNWCLWLCLLLKQSSRTSPPPILTNLSVYVSQSCSLEFQNILLLQKLIFSASLWMLNTKRTFFVLHVVILEQAAQCCFSCCDTEALLRLVYQKPKCGNRSGHQIQLRFINTENPFTIRSFRYCRWI